MKSAKKLIVLALILCLTLTLVPLSTAFAAGTEYHVGFGDDYDYNNITEVPIGSLQPGDTIYIHAPEDGEAFLVNPIVPSGSSSGLRFSQNGTRANPISIIGVANSKGQKPILQDGNMYTNNHNLLVFAGNNYVVDNLVLYGTLKLFVDWVNGEEVTYYSALNTKSTMQNKLAQPLFDRQITMADLCETANGVMTCESSYAAYNGLRLLPARRNSDNCLAKVWASNDNGINGSNGNRVTYRAIYHNADNLVVRNCNVFGAKMGILSSDVGSGDLLVEYSEFANNSYNAGDHNLYLTSDPSMYPNATIRVQYNYIHESNHGNGVKTRATRTEIYYNTFYNNASMSLELIGPDPGYDDAYSFYNVDSWVSKDLNMESQFYIREDADVVGNLIYHTHPHTDLVRTGGDSTSWVGVIEVDDPITRPLFGTSYGRYRFVNNTFIDTTDGYGDGDAHRAVKVQFGIESLEFYNNIFYSTHPDCFAPVAVALGGIEMEGDDGETYFNDDYNAVMWASGERRIAGSNNWVVEGAVDNELPRALDRENKVDPEHVFFQDSVPDEWTNTIYGKNPGFVDAKNGDFRIKVGGAVVGKGLHSSQTVNQWSNWDANKVEARYDWISGTINPTTYINHLVKPHQKDNAFPRPLRTVTYNAPFLGNLTPAERIIRNDDGTTIGAYDVISPTSNNAYPWNEDEASPSVIWWNEIRKTEPKQETTDDTTKGDELISATPDADDSKEAAPQEETKKVYTVTVRRLNVRADATSGSARVARLKRGDTITAIGDPIDGPDGPWLKCELNGKIVYVSTGDGKYVSAN